MIFIAYSEQWPVQKDTYKDKNKIAP